MRVYEPLKFACLKKFIFYKPVCTSLWSIINIVRVSPRFLDNEGDQMGIRIPPQAFTKVSHASTVILSYSILFNSVL